MAAVLIPHIEVRADGVAYLAGTQTKVIEIVLDRLAHHWDADEIQRQHPHLALGQIYAALSYYYDHQPELDREIEEQLQNADRIKASLGESPLRMKLKAMGRLP
jgi:uncharacterized protein (DUF433 family)